MTIFTNESLALPNSSMVFAQQNAYTSMELWYGVIALFAIFMTLSLILDGERMPFEKLMASILAFILSFSNVLASFSLAIINTNVGGTIDVIIGAKGTGTLNAIIPTIVMQNTMTWQIVSTIILILCAVNVVNAVMLLYDLSRKQTGVRQ